MKLSDLKINKLSSELAENTAQLNAKVDKSYVDQKMTGTPKIIKATLSALNTDYPTGSTELALVIADGLLYEWINSTWTSTGLQYQSTGIADDSITTLKQKDSAITLRKTSFAMATQNLLDNDTYTWVQGKVFSTTGNTTNISSEKIYVSVDTNYYFYRFGTSFGGTAYADLYDASDVLLTSITIAQTGYALNIASSTYPTFAYLRIRLYASGGITPQTISSVGVKLQLELGTKLTVYKPYRKLLNPGDVEEYALADEVKAIINGRIYEKKYLINGVNLFNYTEINDGIAWGSDGEALINVTTSNAGTFITDFISVEPSSIYSANASFIRTVAYDSNKQPLSIIPAVTVVSGGQYTYTTPANCYYIKFSAGYEQTSITDYTAIMLYEGSTSKINGFKYKTGFKNPLPTEQWYFGKKLTTFGDSLTQNNVYQPYLIKKYNFIHTNCGIGGTPVGGSAVNAMWQDVRINAIPTDTDILIFMGGTNDGSVTPIGTIDDTDNTTFYGAYQIVLNKLYARIPTAIIILGQIPFRANEGTYLDDYRNAITKIADKYGYPLADTLHIGINQNNYTLYLNTSDGVHHTNVGGAKLASAFDGILKMYEPFDVVS